MNSLFAAVRQTISGAKDRVNPFLFEQPCMVLARGRDWKKRPDAQA
jgi:hypothetical protein